MRPRRCPAPTYAEEAGHGGRDLTVASWILQGLAWALATLFIAGFTNAVRKA